MCTAGVLCLISFHNHPEGHRLLSTDEQSEVEVPSLGRVCGSRSSLEFRTTACLTWMDVPPALVQSRLPLDSSPTQGSSLLRESPGVPGGLLWPMSSGAFSGEWLRSHGGALVCPGERHVSIAGGGTRCHRSSEDIGLRVPGLGGACAYMPHLSSQSPVHSYPILDEKQ